MSGDGPSDDPTFEALMRRYGVMDMIFFNRLLGLVWYREYHDGAWLQGYRYEPVVYWGA